MTYKILCKQVELADSSKEKIIAKMNKLNKFFDANDECKIQVAHVVVDGTAAGQAPCEVYAVCLDLLDIALAPWILVLSDYDCVRVLPQKEYHLVFFSAEGEIFLSCEIVGRIGAVGSAYC